MHFDMLHGVPPQSAPDFIKHSSLADPNNPYGYVEIDNHHLATYPLFKYICIRRLHQAPCSKSGAAIRKQAPVVVQMYWLYWQVKKPGILLRWV